MSHSFIRKILVPVDNAKVSRIALEYAARLARGLGASLDVAHVSGENADGSRELMVISADQDGRPGRPVLVDDREVADLFAELEVKGTIRLDVYLDFADIPGSIATAAQGYDLVVMGTHGRTGLAHLISGSIAEQVIRVAPCPVLTVKEDALRSQGRAAPTHPSTAGLSPAAPVGVL